MRLLDTADPSMLRLTSSAGLTPEQQEDLRTAPVGEGAGGRAVVEEQLVLIEHYASAEDGMTSFRRRGLAIAMAAPIYTDGTLCGSLTIASFDPARCYSAGEQEVLLAFAEHVSLALNDAHALAAAREAEGAKDLFMAMVSHELKTPLTVMMGTLRTLQMHGTALGADVTERMLAAAFERGQHLDRLIDQLLESARAELARDRSERTLGSLMTAALEGFDTCVELRSGDVSDVALKIDATAFHAVVGILLENAATHADDGVVDVTTSLVNHGPTEAVEIAISNPGALPDDLDPAQLFEPFRRSADRLGGGVGLGLYIAARLAAAMDATLSCTSIDGIVSFRLRLALRAEPDQAPMVSRNVRTARA